MSKNDPITALRHMRDYAKKAKAMVAGRSREDLDRDEILNLALVRALHIIGEAATRFPREERKAYPNIRWAEIIGLRNRLVHAYDRIDLDVVWSIATKDVDQLLDELDRIL